MWIVHVSQSQEVQNFGWRRKLRNAQGCTLLKIVHKICCCCSVAKSLYDPMDCSTPGSPVLHYLPEFVQIHVHWVGDAIQPSHPLSSPSPSALNLSQHQGLFQWVGSSRQVAKVFELQLQHQSFQWIFRVDFLNKIENDECPTLKHDSSLTG